MKLVRVADLVGKDIAGLKADIRSRTADGELMYDHQEKDGPRIVTMRHVEFNEEQLSKTLSHKCGKAYGRWMYWEWEKNPSVIPFDCGYSGQLAEDNEHREIHIMMEER